MDSIELGDLGRDVISGFEGVVTGMTYWLNGCVRAMLEPRGLDKDGKVIPPIWVDSAQLQLVRKQVVLSAEARAAAFGSDLAQTGGPPTAGDPTP